MAAILVALGLSASDAGAGAAAAPGAAGNAAELASDCENAATENRTITAEMDHRNLDFMGFGVTP